MASITCDKKGFRRIVFKDTTAPGGRRTIALGDLNKKAAEGIRTHVEHLITAKQYSLPLNTETAGWLAKIGDILHGRLVNACLAETRVAPPAVTIADIIDTFTTRRGPTVKPGTRLVWKQCRNHLVKHFGDTKAAEAITSADADDFRRAMRADYSEAFVAKMTMVAKAFFRDAVRRKLILASPFADVANGSQRNPSRQFFVDAATIQKAIDAAPDIEWRLLIALARFGGLRVPSEPLALRWEDVNWSGNTITVRSSKTEHHAGGASRVLPLFPQLRPLLLEAFENATPGQAHVITRWRTSAVNLRTGFNRILNRAGVQPWPRLWQNLRASCATELLERFPSHVCAAWLGHTNAIADRHYRQVTQAHLAAAVGIPATDDPVQMLKNAKVETPTRNPTQQPPEMAGYAQKLPTANGLKSPDFQGISAICGSVQNGGWAIRDSNPSQFIPKSQIFHNLY